jgi:hypothetical protein
MRKSVLLGAGMLLLAHWSLAQTATQGIKLAGGGRWGVTPDYDYYVYSVALSADGATAIVGGSSGGPAFGAARVFGRSGGVWSQRPNIPLGSDAAGALQRVYSAAISADGGTAIVGGPNDADGVGAAWVFTRSGDTWSQATGKLSAGGGAHYQGVSVAISADGSTAIVGGPGGDEGAAWVYTRSSGVWPAQGTVFATYGTRCGPCSHGASVALSGDGNTALVGAPGEEDGAGVVWVYTRKGGVWSGLPARLVGTGAEGAAGQGWAVAISADGNTAVVGGPGDNGSAGAAWVFVRSADEWSQQGPKLVGSGAPQGAAWGRSVAVSADGDTVVVGGPLGDTGRGAARVFTRSGGAWSQKGNTLVGGAVTQYFGAAVSVSADGSTFLVGAPTDGADGAAWVFSATPPSVWVPVVSHNAGLNGSQWRSDLGLLNAGAVAANVQLHFHGSDGLAASSTTVPAGTQAILTDVIGQLGATGQGALELIPDQPLKVTARSYNAVAGDATCFASGTQGQEYPALAADGGLGAGQSAYLPGLVENAAYRCNIGVVSTDAGGAAVLVELFDGSGAKLTEYTVGLTQGQWTQETQPFRKLAGQTAMDRGFARVTVQSGAAVFAFASVVDNVTNDPTTVTMQR